MGEGVTRDEINERKLRRYRHVWALFLNLSAREVARREDVTRSRIFQIVNSYARMRRHRLWRQFLDPIIGTNWSARYNYNSGAEHKVLSNKPFDVATA